MGKHILLEISDKFKKQPSILTLDKIIEIFFKVEHFCNEFNAAINKYRLETNS
jgi:hypothetical protein